MFFSASSFNSPAYSEAFSQEQMPDSANRFSLLSIFEEDILSSEYVKSNNIFKYVVNGLFWRCYMKQILFVCVENAGRSQMAEAFANYYGKGKLIVSSAGNKPADKVNPTVVEALKEKGIDISMNKPKLLTFQMAQDADLIVTMGCNDQGICPGPFFKPTVDWKLEDPKGKSIDKVREIRDEIERRVQNLIAEQVNIMQKRGRRRIWEYMLD